MESESLNEAIAKNIRPTLDAIDAVRPYVKDVPEIANLIPAIVVVGDQSSGKSSLLESLSGVQLPRGEGICTRVPLELQMRRGDVFRGRIEFRTEEDGEAVVHEDIEEEDIAAEIEAATEAIAGDRKDIRDLPITLRVESPEFPDLTLIDLPGIARVAIGGQSENIEELTMKLIGDNIKGESKVILCVLPATSDFVTSASLKLARKVDPDGERTLGVVTKADMASRGIQKRVEGTDASEVHFRQGCIAVS
eukprot:evm.model.scf_780.5 EVM.evm.TU.scf_780.5   scf_780:39761-42170(+)